MRDPADPPASSPSQGAPAAGPIAIRDDRGRFQRGAPSLNPKGRPRAGTAFAESVREHVNPLELIRIAMDIARGLPAVRDLQYLRAKTEAEVKGLPAPVIEGVEVVWPTQSERIAALTFLRDSGYSKPAQGIELTNGTPAKPLIDYALMTDAELAQLERLQATIADRAQHAIDVGGTSVAPPAQNALSEPPIAR